MLPKLNAPTFEIKLLSQNSPVRYRPFTVKEEKILLIAEESKELGDIAYAIKQIVQNCCVSNLDVNTLPLFDLIHFYIQIRAKSVNNISKVSYKDREDDQIYDFEINFEKIVPVAGEGHSRTVTLDKNFVIEFKYPTYNIIEKISKATIQDSDSTVDLIALTMDKIYMDDQVYICEDTTVNERIEFIESLTTTQYKTILDTFITTMPKIEYVIEYKNSLGNDRKIVLESIEDFFQ